MFERKRDFSTATDEMHDLDTVASLQDDLRPIGLSHYNAVQFDSKPSLRHRKALDER